MSKTPVHPGVTRVEAGFTEDEVKLMTAGVCRDLAAATERGDRWAHRILIGCGVILLAYLFADTLGWF